MFHNRISEKLGAKRVSITKFAKEAGLTYASAYWLYQNKTTQISFEVLAKLMKYFDCKFEDLFEYVPDANNEQAGVA